MATPVNDKLLFINRDTSYLAPKFVNLLQSAIQECEAAGYANISIFEGWRSPQRQSQLYAQGRKTPGKIVTQALPFASAHQYGVAADLAFFKDARWDWEGPWDKITAIFTEHGFDQPPSFEKCHFQVSGGMSTSDMRRIMESSTIQALWMTLGLI